MSDPFSPMALRGRHTQTVKDGASSHKIDYVVQVYNIINLKDNQNNITGSKVTTIFLNGGDFAYWWSCIGQGLCLTRYISLLTCHYMSHIITGAHMSLHELTCHYMAHFTTRAHM